MTEPLVGRWVWHGILAGLLFHALSYGCNASGLEVTPINAVCDASNIRHCFVSIFESGDDECTASAGGNVFKFCSIKRHSSIVGVKPANSLRRDSCINGWHTALFVKFYRFVKFRFWNYGHCNSLFHQMCRALADVFDGNAGFRRLAWSKFQNNVFVSFQPRTLIGDHNPPLLVCGVPLPKGDNPLDCREGNKCDADENLNPKIPEWRPYVLVGLLLLSAAGGSVGFCYGASAFLSQLSGRRRNARLLVGGVVLVGSLLLAACALAWLSLSLATGHSGSNLLYGDSVAMSEERIAFPRIEEIKSKPFVLGVGCNVDERKDVDNVHSRYVVFDVINCLCGEWARPLEVRERNALTWHYNRRNRVVCRYLFQCLFNLFVEEPEMFRGKRRPSRVGYEYRKVRVFVDPCRAFAAVDDRDFVKKLLSHFHSCDFCADGRKPWALLKAHLIQRLASDLHTCFRGNGRISSSFSFGAHGYPLENRNNHQNASKRGNGRGIEPTPPFGRRYVILSFGLIVMWPIIWAGIMLAEHRRIWAGRTLIIGGLCLGLGSLLLCYLTAYRWSWGWWL